MITRLKSHIVWIGASLLLCVTGPMANADSGWVPSGSGAWEVAGNWNPSGVPTAQVVNLYNSVAGAQTYTITSGISDSVARLQSAIDNVTLDFGGNTLTSTSTGEFFRIQQFNQTLTVTNGAYNGQGYINIDASTGSAKMVIGAGAVVSASAGRAGGTTTLEIAASSTNSGMLEVSNGGILNLDNATSGEARIGVTGTGISTFTVNGSTTTVDLGLNTVKLGGAGTGIMNVQAGATVTQQGVLLLGNTSGGNGQLYISGSSSYSTTTSTVVGGSGMTGILSVTDGGTFASGGNVTASAGGTITVGAGSVLTGNLVVINTGGLISGEGAINGPIWLNNSGAVLAASNSGTLTVNSTLSAMADGTIGSGGTVAVAGTTTVNNSRTLTVNGTLGGAGSFAFESSNAAGVSGTGTINKNIALNGNKTLSSSGTLTLGNSLTVAGASNQISSGVVAVSGSTGIGSVTFTNNGVLAGTGNLNVTGSLAGSGSVNKSGGTISGSGVINQAVTLSNGTISGANFSSGVTANGGTVISGGTFNGTLDVSGAGNSLSNAITVVGTTVISSGGSFAVNGTMNGAGGVSVSGELSGDGTINKTVTVNSGGILSPGNSPGSPTYSSLVLNAGGNYNWQVYDATGDAGVDYDTITVTGALNLSGLDTGNKYALNLWSLSGLNTSGDAINFDNSQPYTWTLITAGSITGLGGAIGDYFTINVAATSGTDGFTNALDGGVFSLSSDANAVYLNYAAIPEPGTYAMLGLGLGVLLILRRRSR